MIQGSNRWNHLDLLKVAEMQYKLSLGVLTACNSDDSTFDYYDQFAWGKQGTTKGELALTKEQERFAAPAFEHTATYLMVVQIDAAFKETLGPDHLNHHDPDIRAASRIAWLLRNAFAHNPFAPMWKVYGQHDNQNYNVQGAVTLNTSGLSGQMVKRSHYGGPLALLRLIQFTKRVVEEQMVGCRSNNGPR